MKKLTPFQRAFFEEEGYLVLPGFLSHEKLESLRNALAQLIKAQGGNLSRDQGGFNLEKKPGSPSPFKGDPVGPGILRKIQGICDLSPEFGALAKDPGTLGVVEDLIGPKIRFFESKLFIKSAEHGGTKPWHQDSAYWLPKPPLQASLWLALDDATQENGCLRAVAGSHLEGVRPHVGEELRTADSFHQDPRTVSLPVAAGDAIAFHGCLLHASDPNPTAQQRRALILSYEPQDPAL